MIEATALPTPWQVRYRAGGHEGVADTRKAGLGGAAGPRPHDLLEAALATCMTMTARMALAVALPDADGDVGEVSVRVSLDRSGPEARFRYELVLDPALERHRPLLAEYIANCPVRRTLSGPLAFDPA
ncbi:OsmC family protein [Streptomyces sp. B1866]|uniref:OsmC family protein n=1 Tax=Streptomyces sp. B1866 TaxID=3075431 RepID=UPI00288F0BAA|nr:OsmC family protein [Streptomyces sp. B1866]MDT3397774.1 OsmC family protein [Streptomyces sp. B1866]